jgi:RNA polymerase sigma factor (sigma-70 family)
MTEPRDAATFCDEIRGRLVQALTLYCGNREVGEELAQEALVRVWERWPKVGAMDAPEAWTFRVGMNLANSAFRRRRAERRALTRTRATTAAASDRDVAGATAVREAVAALAPRQRAVVIARYFLDLSVDETAALLGCAPGTVKATTSQALAALRTRGLVDEALPQEVR